MPQNLSDQELRESYWLVTHRAIIRKILLGVWIGALSLLWVSTLWQFINLYALHNTEYRGMIATLAAQAQAAYPLTATQPLMVGNKGSVVGDQSLDPTSMGTGTSDLYAEVSNPNTEWRATFSYSWITNGAPVVDTQGKPIVRTGFILPGDTKYLLQLGEQGSESKSVDLVISQVSWHRMSGRDIFLAKDQLNLTIEQFAFTSTAASGLSQKNKISKASFAVRNQGGHSYPRVGLPIVLMRDSSVVAVNYLTADNLGNGETRLIDSTWYYDFDGVTSAVIRPEVDLFADPR